MRDSEVKCDHCMRTWDIPPTFKVGDIATATSSCMIVDHTGWLIQADEDYKVERIVARVPCITCDVPYQIMIVSYDGKLVTMDGYPFEVESTWFVKGGHGATQESDASEPKRFEPWEPEQEAA